MLCTFKKLIYPKTVAAAQAGEYTVAIYSLNEKMLDAQNNPVKEAKVVGYFLPLAANVRVDAIPRRFSLPGKVLKPIWRPG